LTHRNVVANLLQLKAMIEPVVKDGQEFMVTALPLYHIFALTCNCLSFMTLGGTNLLITNPKDFPTFIKAMSKYPITAFAGINTLFNGLLNCDEFKNIDFSRLKLTFAGGMATQKSVADHWHAVTGSVVLEGFGLTECAPCVTTSPYNQTSFSGNIGLPLPETDIKLMNEQGVIVAIGVAGELWVKGPQVMKGYYNCPEASNEVLKDGWLATGDIATIDQHGFLTIIDRKKDMIIVSGFNVYPNEIEEIIAMMDDVIEVAAIGVPCEKTGEKVKIFLVTKSGQLNEKAVMAHCRTLLTNYKVPRDFELRDELPKSNVGKILRKELRQ
ncbi:MAG: AMP-binding protein, partial [Paraglaciecola sp.]|nr:AMP-binding protein [Paraglaciecola sp.]